VIGSVAKIYWRNGEETAHYVRTPICGLSEAGTEGARWLDLEEQPPMLDISTPITSLDPADWVDKCACRGKSDLFFAPFAERPEARVRREAAARIVCEACPVLMSCRAHARENRELGFWGGESEAERAGAGYAPTTPIIGRRQVAEQRAARALERRGR
jgi:WhiB family redox-sensing transcriptional regulator